MKNPTILPGCSPARAHFALMRGAVAVLIAASLAFSGCSRTPVKPPRSPLMEAKKDERIDEEHLRDLERRHMAPPPAYGNKVVMAVDDSRPGGHF